MSCSVGTSPPCQPLLSKNTRQFLFNDFEANCNILSNFPSAFFIAFAVTLYPKKYLPGYSGSLTSRYLSVDFLDRMVAYSSIRRFVFSVIIFPYRCMLLLRMGILTLWHCPIYSLIIVSGLKIHKSWHLAATSYARWNIAAYFGFKEVIRSSCSNSVLFKRRCPSDSNGFLPIQEMSVTFFPYIEATELLTSFSLSLGNVDDWRFSLINSANFNLLTSIGFRPFYLHQFSNIAIPHSYQCCVVMGLSLNIRLRSSISLDFLASAGACEL